MEVVRQHINDHFYNTLYRTVLNKILWEENQVYITNKCYRSIKVEIDNTLRQYKTALGLLMFNFGIRWR